MVKDELQNVTQVTTDGFVEITKTLTMNGEIPCGLGAPGIGKTWTTRKVAKDIAKKLNCKFVENPTVSSLQEKKEDGSYANFHYTVVMANTLETSDVNGVPFPVEENGEKRTVFIPTNLFPKEGQGIIHLDEFFNAPPYMQTVFQHILLEHKVGNVPISKDMKFVITSNRPQDGSYSNVSNASNALKDRMFWVEINPSGWEKWLQIMADNNEPVHHMIVGFMNPSNALGSKFLDSFDPTKNQYTMVTRRKLSKISKLMYNVEDDKLMRKLMGAGLGEAFAQQFYAWKELSETVNMSDIYANPNKINDHIDDVGVLFSICASMVGHVKSVDTAKEVLAVLNHLKTDEYGTFVLKSLIAKPGVGKAKVADYIMKSGNDGREVLNRYHALIKNDE